MRPPVVVGFRILPVLDWSLCFCHALSMKTPFHREIYGQYHLHPR